MAAHLHLVPDPGPRDPGREGLPVTVILADDHHAVRRSLRLLLDREEDVEVIGEAADLSTVLRHVPDCLPQVLVLDLRLPGGSSIEAIRRLRAEVPTTQTVVVTMEESPVFVDRALHAGATGFVLKDRADTELPAAVRCAARGERYVSERIGNRPLGRKLLVV